VGEGVPLAEEARVELGLGVPERVGVLVPVELEVTLAVGVTVSVGVREAEGSDVQAEAPAAETWPLGQAVQAALLAPPETALEVPAGHCVQLVEAALAL